MITILLFLLSCSDITIIDQAEDRVVIDSFVQPGKLEKLDVLAAIDTSCSMVSSGNLTKVSESMLTLRDDVENLTNDYQFIFITTDEKDPDVTGPLTELSADFEFSYAVSALEAPAGEAGFGATYQFLTYQDVYTRRDAPLLVFMFSDEPEQSVIVPDDYFDWITTKFADRDVDVVTISTWKEPSCGMPDQKYADVSRLFGHEPLDICDPDWATKAAKESFIVTQLDYIILSEIPVEDSVVVYVDSLETSDYTYVPEENKIQLGFVPAGGSLVEVGYEVLVN